MFKFEMQRFVSNEQNNLKLVLNADDNEIIYNSGNFVTLTGGNFDSTVKNDGDNVVISLGGGNDSVESSSKNSFIFLGDGNNTLSYNGGEPSKLTIISGAGKDSIYNVANNSYIYTGADNDIVHCYGNEFSTVLTGDGDDLFYGEISDGLIDCGNGNDTVKSSCQSEAETIIGGRGDDEIHLHYKDFYYTFDYVYGDGNDTIWGFNSDDTLRISTPYNFGTVVSGDDQRIVFNNGSILLKNSKGSLTKNNLIIIPVDTEDIQNSKGDTTINNSFTTEVTNNVNVLIVSKEQNFIENFTAGKSKNSNVLYLQTSILSMRREGEFISFYSTDGTKLQVNSSASSDEIIQYTTDGKNVSYAKIGRANESNTFTYEDGVNFYQGGETVDVLNVTDYQSRNVWLDGSQGIGFNNVNNINASSSTGNNTLAGDSGNNQITAGSGKDTLWGGAGEDTLIGGDGENMFWYGKGDGSDVINNSSANDTVNLYNVNLSDITSVSYSGKIISLGLNGGGSLQVNSAEEISSTFQLADGSKWQYDHDYEEWQPA